MSITYLPTDIPDEPGTQALAHAIRVECERALRRLDALNRERHDVVLEHASAFIRHAASLSETIERRQTLALARRGSGQRAT
jgi:hypothetical protein